MAETVIVPSAKPLHETSTDTSDAILIADGSVIETFTTVIQPTASVTVAECVPVGILVSAVVIPPVLHWYE